MVDPEVMNTFKLIEDAADTSHEERRKSWKEFRDTGLLWFINMILHVFGWAIFMRVEDGKIVDVYPHRTELRGFEVKTNTEGYQKVSKYMKENAKELYKETKE